MAFADKDIDSARGYLRDVDDLLTAARGQGREAIFEAFLGARFALRVVLKNMGEPPPAKQPKNLDSRELALLKGLVRSFNKWIQAPDEPPPKAFVGALKMATEYVAEHGG